MRVMAFVGRSGSGKTTLLERLLPVLKGRGYRVAVIKHTPHAHVETDKRGTDTWRMWRAGAAQTVLAAPDRIASVQRCARPPSAEEALAVVGEVDVVLVEGFKGSQWPKVEVVRAACDPHRLAGMSNVVALVSDVVGLGEGGVPVFGFDEVEALADFVLRAGEPVRSPGMGKR